MPVLLPRTVFLKYLRPSFWNVIIKLSSFSFWKVRSLTYVGTLPHVATLPLIIQIWVFTVSLEESQLASIDGLWFSLPPNFLESIPPLFQRSWIQTEFRLCQPIAVVLNKIFLGLLNFVQYNFPLVIPSLTLKFQTDFEKWSVSQLFWQINYVFSNLLATILPNTQENLSCLIESLLVSPNCMFIALMHWSWSEDSR